MAKTKFRATPDNRVVSTFTTKEDVDALVSELQAVGFKNDAHVIGVHYGEEGKNFIDPDGSRHGFLTRLTRARQRLGSWESSMLEDAETALNSGHYVASTLTDGSKTQRTIVLKIMQKYTSKAIYYHGNYSMEILQQARDEADSQQLMRVDPFEVGIAEMPVFLKNQQQTMTQLKHRQGFIQARLHQSIQENPQFRFINMTRWANSTTFSAASGESGNANVYRQVVEQVGREAEFQEHIIVINLMEIAKEAADSFEEKWGELSLPVTQMDGFISATLYRSINPDAHIQFVNYAQWNSTEAHSKFRQQMETVAPDGMTIHSGQYQVALQFGN